MSNEPLLRCVQMQFHKQFFPLALTFECLTSLKYEFVKCDRKSFHQMNIVNLRHISIYYLCILKMPSHGRLEYI